MPIEAILTDQRTIVLKGAPTVLVDGLPGRQYHPSSKQWSFPATPFVAHKILRRLQRSGVEYTWDKDITYHYERYVSIYQHIRKEPQPKLEDKIPLHGYTRDLWPHQWYAYQRASRMKSAMLACGMGTGKTFIGTLLIGMHGRTSLILAPNSVVHDGVWSTEIASVWDVSKKGSIGVLELCEGTSTQRRDRAINFFLQDIDYRVVVINFQSSWREPFATWAESIWWDTMLVDESHHIKGAGSAVSNHAFLYGMKATHRYCLSGTALPETPLDVYGQYRFLDCGIYGTSHAAFEEKYAIKGGYEGYEIIGLKNQKHLARRFHSIAIVVPEDVIKLPPVVPDIERAVPMGDKCARLFKEFDKELMIEVGGGVVTADNSLVKTTVLRRLASGCVKREDGKLQRVDTARVDMLEEFLLDADPHEPMVIFYQFKWDRVQIIQMLRRIGRTFSRIDGTAKTQKRWRAGKTQYLLVQYSSGQEGLSFVRSCWGIFYSMPQKLVEYLQSRKRIHRPGQTRPCRFVHLFVKGTKDRTMYRALVKKQNPINAIIEDRRNAYQHTRQVDSGNRPDGQLDSAKPPF